ncbi:Secreted chorismate mutase precursor [Serratia plymuthica]|uniref:Chorismate mutase n=1 Tax=Serratia plymuthica S13 TaxID=1348660 RepID=S4YI64_SERPL|nr:chorismate mutase [Serratia plymuthica]AGP44161.1 chorismate mutase [Serratia plymuthica S13]KYG18419.1 Secreted chorismate mutase precursor [Serratia plymuthica]QQT81870.1 chorismate mutase [Serratia plymuthica]
MFRALLFACCLASFSAQAGEGATLGELVNQRLAYMKDVAGYKAQQHLPIEDLAQEAKVLASTEAEAGRLGLAPRSVRPFIVAQMDAAKAIQYRYRADWLATPESGWQPRPLDSVRPQIAELSNRILQRLAQQLKAGPLTEQARGAFVSAIRQPNLSDADKQRLFTALLAVRADKAG